MIVEKAWGTTECLIKTPFVEAHRIFVRPHGKCSWHRHERKVNAFIGISGDLTITAESFCHELTVGDVDVVPHRECHRFTAGPDGAVAIELYYPAEMSDDIVRFNTVNLEDVA